LPLAGTSLIERALAWLAGQRVIDVVINLHHRPETISGLVGDGAQFGQRVRYSWEPVILGSAGGPRHALPLLDADTFLVVNAEPVCEVALEPLIATHRRTGADVTLAVVPNPSPDTFNGLVADAEGRVEGRRMRGDAAGTWHFVGVQVVNASVFSTLPDNEPAETIGGVYETRFDTGRIRVLPVTTRPYHVGTVREYLETAVALAHVSACDAVIEAGVAQVATSACLRRSVVWAGARIGPRVTLSDCVVTGGAEVPAGFEARDVVITPQGVADRADRVERRAGLALFPIPARAGGVGR
jgi:NDP-sugar pyrophosphorylase family protein